jgi:hypothetical protein
MEYWFCYKGVPKVDVGAARRQDKKRKLNMRCSVNFSSLFSLLAKNGIDLAEGEHHNLRHL